MWRQRVTDIGIFPCLPLNLLIQFYLNNTAVNFAQYDIMPYNMEIVS